jgi:hypothetical protein
MKMKMAGVGGLYSRVQFNLATEKGREAFASVAFFGQEQEWSIGYKTLQATFDPTMQANVLREVELYEVSPVLHGANQLTATLSVKSDDGGEKCGPEGMHGGMHGGMNASRPGSTTIDIPRFNLIPAKPRSFSTENERTDIFAQGESGQLGDEARTALEMELSSRSASPLRVVNATENSVVFDRTMPDGTRMTYRIGYHRESQSGRYMFGKPEKMASQQIVPSQMPSMPMSVKPGYVTRSYSDAQQPIAMMKSFDEQLDQAVEILSNAGEDETIKESELQKIQDAIDYLRNLADGQQKKTALEYSVWCKPQYAYKVKSLLDPVLNYHRLEAHVDDYGVHVTSGLNEDSLQALRSAHKNIASYLDGGGGSKKGDGAPNTKAAPKTRIKALSGKIGPKIGGGLRAAPAGMAFVDITGVTDADSDGIVFEGKPGLERPIIPRFIVPKNLARKLSSIVEGDAESIEKQRRAGNGNVSFDEKKLRGIIDDIGGDPNLLQNISSDGMRSRGEMRPIGSDLPFDLQTGKPRKRFDETDEEFAKRTRPLAFDLRQTKPSKAKYSITNFSSRSGMRSRRGESKERRKAISEIDDAISFTESLKRSDDGPAFFFSDGIEAASDFTRALEYNNLFKYLDYESDSDSDSGYRVSLDLESMDDSELNDLIDILNDGQEPEDYLEKIPTDDSRGMRSRSGDPEIDYQLDEQDDRQFRDNRLDAPRKKPQKSMRELREENRLKRQREAENDPEYIQYMLDEQADMQRDMEREERGMRSRRGSTYRERGPSYEEQFEDLDQDSGHFNNLLERTVETMIEDDELDPKDVDWSNILDNEKVMSRAEEMWNSDVEDHWADVGERQRDDRGMRSRRGYVGPPDSWYEPDDDPLEPLEELVGEEWNRGDSDRYYETARDWTRENVDQYKDMTDDEWDSLLDDVNASDDPIAAMHKLFKEYDNSDAFDDDIRRFAESDLNSFDEDYDDRGFRSRLGDAVRKQGREIGKDLKREAKKFAREKGRELLDDAVDNIFDRNRRDRGMRSRRFREDSKPDKKLKPAYGRRGPVQALQNMSDEELVKLLQSYGETAWRPWDRNPQSSSLLLRDRPSLSSLVQELDSRGYDVYQSEGREPEYFGDYSAGDKSVYARKRGQEPSPLERMLNGEMSWGVEEETKPQDVIDSQLEDRRRSESKTWKATVPDDYKPSDGALETLTPAERRLLETFKPKSKAQRKQEMLDSFRNQAKRDVDSNKPYDTWDWYPTFEEWDQEYKKKLRQYRKAQRKAYAHDLEKGNVKPVEERAVQQTGWSVENLDWDNFKPKPLRFGPYGGPRDVPELLRGFRSKITDGLRNERDNSVKSTTTIEQRAFDILAQMSQRSGQKFGLSDKELQDIFDGDQKINPELMKIVRSELKRQGFTKDDVADVLSGRYAGYARNKISGAPDDADRVFEGEMESISNRAFQESMDILSDGLTIEEFQDFVSSGRIPQGKESILRRANEVYDNIVQDSDKQRAMGLRSRTGRNIDAEIDTNIKKQRDLEKELDDEKIDLAEFRRRQAPLRQEFSDLRKEQGAQSATRKAPELDATGRPRREMIERDEKGKVKFDSEKFLAEQNSKRRSTMSELGFTEEEINALMGASSSGMRSRGRSNESFKNARALYSSKNKEKIADRLTELTQRRNELNAKSKELLDQYYANGRDFNDEENDIYDEIENELDDVNDEIRGISDWAKYATSEDTQRWVGRTGIRKTRMAYRKMLDDGEISQGKYDRLLEDLIDPTFFDDEHWDSVGAIPFISYLRDVFEDDDDIFVDVDNQLLTSEKIDDLSSDFAAEKVAEGLANLNNRGMRSRSGKKNNSEKRKMVTKLTPDQVRIMQEQKLRSKKIPGKKKDGPSKNEWGFRSREDFGNSAGAAINYLSEIFSKDNNDLSSNEKYLRRHLLDNGIKIDFYRGGREGSIGSDISLRDNDRAGMDDKLDALLNTISKDKKASDILSDNGFLMDDRIWETMPSYKNRPNRKGPKLGDRERGVQARANITDLAPGDVLPENWDDETSAVGGPMVRIADIRSDGQEDGYVTMVLENMSDGTTETRTFGTNDTFPNVSRPSGSRGGRQQGMRSRGGGQYWTDGAHRIWISDDEEQNSDVGVDAMRDGFRPEGGSGSGRDYYPSRRRRYPTSTPKQTAPKPDDGDQLISDASSITGNDLAASIVQQYKQRGRLTDKQWNALRGIVSKNKKPSAGPSAKEGVDKAEDIAPSLSNEDKKAIIEAARGLSGDFAKSVVSQYNSRGRLSDKQWAALDKATRKIRGTSTSAGMRSRANTGSINWDEPDENWGDGAGGDVETWTLPDGGYYQISRWEGGGNNPGGSVATVYDANNKQVARSEEFGWYSDDAKKFLQDYHKENTPTEGGMRSRRSYDDESGSRGVREGVAESEHFEGSMWIDQLKGDNVDADVIPLADIYGDDRPGYGVVGVYRTDDGFGGIEYFYGGDDEEFDSVEDAMDFLQNVEDQGNEDILYGDPEFRSLDRVRAAGKPGRRPLEGLRSRSGGTSANVEADRRDAADNSVSNPISPNRLNELSGSDDVETRINVANNDGAFLETVNRLLEDDDLDVRKAADENIQRRFGAIANQPGSDRRKPASRQRREAAKNYLAQHEERMQKAGMRSRTMREQDPRAYDDVYELIDQGLSDQEIYDSLASSRISGAREITLSKIGQIRSGGRELTQDSNKRGFVRKKNTRKINDRFDGQQVARLSASRGGRYGERADIEEGLSDVQEIADGMRSKAGTGLGESREIYPSRRMAESSAVDFVRYDAAKEELVVQYKGGGAYVFGGISADDADSIEEAESLGKALNDVKRNATYSVKPNGDVNGVESTTADFLERDLRRVPLSEDNRSVYGNAIRLLRDGVDEDSDFAQVQSQVTNISNLANEMWENDEYAASNFLSDAAEKINKKLNSVRGQGGFRSRAGARHQRMEVNLSVDEIGLIRDEIRGITAKHGGNGLITYGMKKYDNLLEELQNQKKSNPGRSLIVLSSEYDNVMTAYDELEKVDPSWIKMFGADPLEMASVSKEGKYISPNVDMPGEEFDGKRINNGAPADITPRMQGQLVDWGRRQPNFRIVKGLIEAHKKNNGTMTARQWSTLRNMFDRFSEENRSGGVRSRVGSGMRSETGSAVSSSRTGKGKGPRSAKDVLPENYETLSLDEKFDALISAGKYDESTNPNGIQVGEYNAAFRRLRDAEDEQDRITARREALAERMKRSAEAGPVTRRPEVMEQESPRRANDVETTPEKRAALAKRTRQKQMSAIEKVVAKAQDSISGAIIDGDAEDEHGNVWNEVMDLVQAEDGGDDADLTLSKLSSIIEALDDYTIGFEGEEMSPAERKSVNNATKLKNTLEELYDDIDSDPFIKRGSTSREQTGITLAGEEDDSIPRFMTGEGLRSRSSLVNGYIGARKNAERQPRAGMRSRSGTEQDGRAEIRWEATEFNKVEQSLSREISEAQKSGDSKTANALRNLTKIMDRQKSGDVGGKRTNAGALYLTQNELDDVMDALMHVVDRQTQTDGSRTNMFAQMLDKLAEAGMTTFIRKTAKPVNSRFVEKTNESGRTVKIPLNE